MCLEGLPGFLAAALEYIFRDNTSQSGVIEREDDDGNKTTIFTGDRLNPDERRHVQVGMFFGFDFDVTMLRIASMNLILHGLDNPNIHYCDTLANSMPERFPKLAQDHFDAILANPPFKRTPLPERDKDGRPNNDLPDVVAKWKQWDIGRGKKQFGDRKARAFFVGREQIAAQDYDLSIGRYKEHVYEEVKHDAPQVILSRLKDLEKEIAADIGTLEKMLG